MSIYKHKNKIEGILTIVKLRFFYVISLYIEIFM